MGQFGLKQPWGMTLIEELARGSMQNYFGRGLTRKKEMIGSSVGQFSSLVQECTISYYQDVTDNFTTYTWLSNYY